MRCSKCKDDKREDEFHLNRTKKRGRQHHCKSCSSERARSPKEVARRREYMQRRGRHFRFRRKYGVTEGWYDAQVVRQGNICAICGTDEYPRSDCWFIDHGHMTGKVRSLLCDVCNMGLGSFRDSPHLLAIAIAYLESQDFESPTTTLIEGR